MSTERHGGRDQRTTNLKQQGGVGKEDNANIPLAPLSQGEQSWYERPHEELVIAIKSWLVNNRARFKELYPSWARKLDGRALDIAILREEIYSNFTVAAARTYQKQGPSAEYLKKMEEPELSFLHVLNAWDCVNYHRYFHPIQSEARQGQLRQLLPMPQMVILNHTEGKLFDAMAEAVPLSGYKLGQRTFPVPRGLIE